MTSIRLPGKVALELAGKPVLHHVLSRCRTIPGVDVVVCAIPDDPNSEPLEVIAAASGVVSFRGSEDDVLDRYLGAARAVAAKVVLRVTSDCPLIDPGVCNEVIQLREKTGADYAANNMPPSFPHGLDCEAFTAAALEETASVAKSADDREHVTTWLRRAAHLKRVNLSSGNPALAAHRWTLDYEEDFSFLRMLFEEMPNAGAARMQAIVDFLKLRPDIVDLNALHRRS
jgi:spore coat polysaccharide biosynthesis protein SpsF (cytidylyltransferase family)